VLVLLLLYRRESTVIYKYTEIGSTLHVTFITQLHWY